MAIASMTGFARQESAMNDGAQAGQAPSWTWEAKSVNHRGLDVRCRLPAGFDRLEQPVRRQVQTRFSRGSVQIGLSFERPQHGRSLRINHDWLDHLLAVRESMEHAVSGEPPKFEILMTVRGVIEEEEDGGASADDLDALNEALLADCAQVLDRLETARAEEGARLEETLRGQIAEIDRLVGRAGGQAAAQPEAMRARLNDLIDGLMEDQPSLPADRLAHEVALLVAKADVREELDRLAGHVTAARDLLEAGGVIGRRLDFLCQEFNREANTLCAKSGDLGLTETGLALKAVIDQMREQVQNVE